VEGAARYTPLLEQFVISARKRGYEFVTMAEMARDLLRSGTTIPQRTLGHIQLSGARHGVVGRGVMRPRCLASAARVLAGLGS
jgi:hypothetical protein